MGATAFRAAEGQARLCLCPFLRYPINRVFIMPPWLASAPRQLRPAWLNGLLSWGKPIHQIPVGKFGRSSPTFCVSSGTAQQSLFAIFPVVGVGLRGCPSLGADLARKK